MVKINNKEVGSLAKPRRARLQSTTSVVMIYLKGTTIQINYA